MITFQDHIEQPTDTGDIVAESNVCYGSVNRQPSTEQPTDTGDIVAESNLCYSSVNRQLSSTEDLQEYHYIT